MDPQHLPAVIGTCAHCHQELYASAPLALDPGGEMVQPIAHVACAVHERRAG